MDTSKNTFAFAAPAVMSLLLTAMPGAAQAGSPQEPTKPAQQQPRVDKPELHIVRQDILIGAKVTNSMQGDAKKTLGSISDLVVDTASGTVRNAVLSNGGMLGIGEKSMLVPWSSLTWDAKNSTFVSTLTEEAVAKLPAFEPDKLNRVDRTAAEASAPKDAGTGHASAGTAGETAGAGKPMPAGHGQVLLASTIDKCDVFARADKVGTCAHLFVETGSGSTAFLAVDSGGVLRVGEALVVPWAALQWERAGKEPVRVRIDKAQADLTTAPRLDDRGVDLGQAGFRARLYEFYGVPKPAFDGVRDEPKIDHEIARKQDRAR